MTVKELEKLESWGRSSFDVIIYRRNYKSFTVKVMQKLPYKDEFNIIYLFKYYLKYSEVKLGISF